MKSEVIVTVICRLPGKSVVIFSEQLISMLQHMSGENKTLYLIGAFNINLLNFENHHPTNDFLETPYSYSLTPLITKPTRITEDTRSTELPKLLAFASRLQNGHIPRLYQKKTRPRLGQHGRIV